MSLLLPFSYTDPISFWTNNYGVSCLRLLVENHILKHNRLRSTRIWLDGILFTCSTDHSWNIHGWNFIFTVVIGTVWVACVAWDLLRQSVYLRRQNG